MLRMALLFALAAILWPSISFSETNNPQAYANPNNQPNAHQLEEMLVKQVSKEGVLHNRYLVEGMRYGVHYIVGIPVALAPSTGCTFYVGQDLIEIPQDKRSFAAIGFQGTPPSGPNPITLKAMGAYNHLSESCSQMTPEVIETSFGMELIQNNPTQKEIKQVIILNTTFQPEHYLVTLTMADGKITIRKLPR